MNDLERIVALFADSMTAVDSERPVAKNVRSGASYQPGIGPHTEKQTVEKVLSQFPDTIEYDLEVPYPENPRTKCDIVFRKPFLWSVEVKMLRLMGDNGKPNDNILMHILSPYPQHRSAVTDTEKLLSSSLPDRKAILIYGYDYDDFPMDPAINAFELLASQRAALSERIDFPTGDLIHPVHRRGWVFGWEILGRY